MSMHDGGTMSAADWAGIQNARMRQHEAGLRRSADANTAWAVRALCDIGIQAMQKQSPAMMANVDRDSLLAVMSSYILPRQ